MLKGNRLGLFVGAVCILLVGIDLMQSAALGGPELNTARSDDAPRVVAISAYPVVSGNGSSLHYVFRQWSDGTLEWRYGAPSQYEMNWNPWNLVPQ